jgi:hypothetical protein
MAEHRKVSAANGGTTDPVILNGGNASVGLRLAGGGSGRIQYTLSYPSQVEGDTATWKDSAAGVVSVDTDLHITSPVTAVRGVSAVGAITLEVVF